jgi:hypothetical protein
MLLSDLLHTIFLYLDLENIKSCIAVCKSFYNIFDKHYWVTKFSIDNIPIMFDSNNITNIIWIYEYKTYKTALEYVTVMLTCAHNNYTVINGIYRKACDILPKKFFINNMNEYSDVIIKDVKIFPHTNLTYFIIIKNTTPTIDYIVSDIDIRKILINIYYWKYVKQFKDIIYPLL